MKIYKIKNTSEAAKLGWVKRKANKVVKDV